MEVHGYDSLTKAIYEPLQYKMTREVEVELYSNQMVSLSHLRSHVLLLGETVDCSSIQKHHIYYHFTGSGSGLKYSKTQKAPACEPL